MKHIVLVKTNWGERLTPKTINESKILSLTVSKVVWNDGHESWATAYSRWNGDTGSWEVERIGAGAHGDLTVWTKDGGVRKFLNSRLTNYVDEK